ncbi:MAG: hypothetical protein KAF27_06485 [Porphyrobacter sp.]|nr:hypothetical protein [Porphyrobacter sp.]
MPRRRNRALFAAAVLAVLAAGCELAPTGAAAPDSAPARARLGLMTSLPLYWPLGAGVADIAAASAPLPWQRSALEQVYAIEPLDTLSPIPGLTPDAPETDPLAGLTRIAVIQPRGLSPADNVALDDWVRAGGRLLMVLDPLLTGEYDLPLGDPRRPTDTALIPPVVARWGLAVSHSVATDEAANYGSASLPGGIGLPLAHPGRIAILPEGAGQCALAEGSAVMATCRIGKGTVTLIADAALFEHPEAAGEGGAALRRLVQTVLQ